VRARGEIISSPPQRVSEHDRRRARGTPQRSPRRSGIRGRFTWRRRRRLSAVPDAGRQGQRGGEGGPSPHAAVCGPRSVAGRRTAAVAGRGRVSGPDGPSWACGGLLLPRWGWAPCGRSAQRATVMAARPAGLFRPPDPETPPPCRDTGPGPPPPSAPFPRRDQRTPFRQLTISARAPKRQLTKRAVRRSRHVRRPGRCCRRPPDAASPGAAGTRTRDACASSTHVSGRWQAA
jgi:hypothetical protein